MKRTPRKPLAPEIQRQLYQELFANQLSKSEKRRLEILDGAIQAYAGVDFNHVSYDDVALPAKTSRRLVQHYFPDKDELFQISMKMIRAKYQASVIQAMSRAETPWDRFKAYIHSAVVWAHIEPLHMRNWILYCLVCAQQSRLRFIHQEMADVGEVRIMAMIKDLAPNRKISEVSLSFAAKTVQRLITGAALEISSERGQPQVEKIIADVVRACEILVKSL